MNDEDREERGVNRATCPVCGQKTLVFWLQSSYSYDYGTTEYDIEFEDECGCIVTSEQYDAAMEAIEEAESLQ